MHMRVQGFLATSDAILHRQMAEPAPEGGPVCHARERFKLFKAFKLPAGDGAGRRTRIGQAMGEDVEAHSLGPFSLDPFPRPDGGARLKRRRLRRDRSHAQAA